MTVLPPPPFARPINLVALGVAVSAALIVVYILCWLVALILPDAPPHLGRRSAGVPVQPLPAGAHYACRLRVLAVSKRFTAWSLTDLGAAAM
jgi:hypothetical protein